MRCSGTGWGFIGAPLAQRAYDKCVSDLRSVGYLEVEEAGATGIQVSLADPTTARIIAVMPNSPAANAGVLVGDRIIEVNGQPVATTAIALQLMFGRKGETVSIRVRRGEEEKPFTLARTSRAALRIAPQPR
jgi:C-terminal processing protease CtpA/Prc